MIFAPRTFSALLALVLGLRASISSGERLFIGVLEADGYQSALYGASAFSRVADLPLALEMVNDGLSKNFLLPSFSCISASETFRVVQTVDPSLPRADNNPANVAILPLNGNDATVHQLFESAYATRRDCLPFTWYEHAKTSNLAARVIIGTSARHLMTSTSQEALQWAWENRTRLIDAPPQGIPGTFRVLVNPQRFADLLGTRSEQAASLFNFDKILRDFDTFSFSLTLDGQAATLTARGTPRDGSTLDTLVKALRPPRQKLWEALPDEAFFSSLSASDNPQAWGAYFGALSRLPLPACDAVPREALSGDHLAYLASTGDKKGLCLVRIAPVQTAEPVRDGLRRLHTVKLDNGIVLKREPTRTKGDLQIETYSLAFQMPNAEAQGPQKQSESATLFTLTSLFLKQAVLEATLTEGHLISVLGPPNSIDDQLGTLKFQEKAFTLQRKIVTQDSALGGSLCHGASLHMAALLRQIVTIMPGVKPEHLRAFPQGGDGVAFGISRGDDRLLNASLRLQTSEIAALQRINRNGREVLQELVFQLFSNQMLHMQEATKGSSIKK